MSSIPPVREPAEGTTCADLSRHVNGLMRDRPESATSPPPDSAARHLPDCSAPTESPARQDLYKYGGDGDQLARHRSRLLLDPSASPEMRLAAVQELSKAGTSNLKVLGTDGQTYDLRLERESAGSREMVHLFVTGPDGKERTVLRGIANSRGEFERERDAAGNSVGWFGSGANVLQTAFASDSADRQRGTLRGQRLDDLRQRGTQNPPLDFRIEPCPPNSEFEPRPHRSNLPPNYRPYDLGPYLPPRPDLNGDRPPERLPNRSRPPEYQMPYRTSPDPPPYQEDPRWRQLPPRTNPYHRPGRPEFAPPNEGNIWPRPSNFDGQAAQQMIDRAAQDAHNQARRLIATSGGIYLRSAMSIDSDGSPRARQIDPFGQVNTTMRYADNRSVNSEVVPYMVLPGGAYQRYGVQLGDMVLVRNKENGRTAVAVFADVGPRHRTGEGSMALAREMGLDPSPTRGGTTRPSIEYLVLPNTHGTKPRNEQDLMARIAAVKRQFGLG